MVPGMFAVGAAMELFMIKTGFYEIVTRKEAERRLEAEMEHQKRLQRLKAAGVDVDRVK